MDSLGFFLILMTSCRVLKPFCFFATLVDLHFISRRLMFLMDLV